MCSDFWRQVQEHEQQMFEHELRIQKFREAVADVMAEEGRANKALSDSLQAAMAEIDKAVNKLGGK
jgi:predicted  nucleic acid-binding Zn-ribbon protein